MSVWAKKMGLRRVPNVTNLKSNTMKNVVQRYEHLFAPAIPMMRNLLFFTFLLICIKPTLKKYLKILDMSIIIPNFANTI
ncbi:hypothetical protein HMPREF1640_02025 [Prevotella sp. S7-1-8]|nr:hypothetical protein HMPREF1640_02025 [Prevotella sp. S7-1-8]